MNNLTGVGRAERLIVDPSPTRAEIVTLVARELDQVERLFRKNLASPLEIVDEIGEFVANGGGKRVRPTLHLLCAKMCGYSGPHDIQLATVLEFIHSATLIHDDIIDAARTRRGRPSVNYGWGNNLTVLFGDYLFAKAMEMALSAGSLKVMEKLAEVTLRMTEGEMLQTRYAGRIDLTRGEYLDLVERKTAALFGCCCELAGILAGVGESQVAALKRYGLQLGMAFQLVDDLLDFTGNSATLGKPAASDLREGKATLAVIDLLSTETGQARKLVARIVDGAPSGSAEIERLTRLLHERGSIERSHATAQAYAAAALNELEGFDEGPARTCLQTLPDLLLFRDR